jgi:hypothetical protein
VAVAVGVIVAVAEGVATVRGAGRLTGDQPGNTQGCTI